MINHIDKAHYASRPICFIVQSIKALIDFVVQFHARLFLFIECKYLRKQINMVYYFISAV